MKFVEQVANLKGKVRLSDYVHLLFPHLISRKAGQKAIKKGHVYLNGILGNSYDWIHNGDQVTLEETQIAEKKIDIPIPIIYEDDHIAVLDKPAGINVSGNRKAISHYLNTILSKSNQFDILPRYTAVHRLDRDTKGLLIVAKTKSAQQSLHTQIESRSIYKSYKAIIIGKLPQVKGSITQDIDGKIAITDYEVIQQKESCLFGNLSLINLNIQTGRKHQIRIHLSNLGNPVLGDKQYNKHKPIGVGKGMFLFATHLRFTHPYSQDDISFDAPLPPKVDRVLDYYS